MVVIPLTCVTPPSSVCMCLLKGRMVGNAVVVVCCCVTYLFSLHFLYIKQAVSFLVWIVKTVVVKKRIRVPNPSYNLEQWYLCVGMHIIFMFIFCKLLFCLKWWIFGTLSGLFLSPDKGGRILVLIVLYFARSDRTTCISWR